MEDKDSIALYYLVVPCSVLAVLIHPSASRHIVNRIACAFCVCLEAVSVLPQPRLMQNTKCLGDRLFTAHCVFAIWLFEVLKLCSSCFSRFKKLTGRNHISATGLTKKECVHTHAQKSTDKL